MRLSEAQCKEIEVLFGELKTIWEAEHEATIEALKKEKEELEKIDNMNQDTILHLKETCDGYESRISELESSNKGMEWPKYDFLDLESHPKVTGRYLVYRKNNKMQFEVWNGTGWAYNNNDITHYALPNIPTK